MTTSVAFFLSPHGQLVHVPLNHISKVIADSEGFGLTFEVIRAAYDRHGERIWVEGEARKEILLQIIACGWIRLRRYPNRQWSVTVHALTPAVQELLLDWATQMLFGINGF